MHKFENCLVVGISSRALFDLEEENRIFDEAGVEAYTQYQIEHENDILKPGTGFALIKALLKLNEIGSEERKTEIIVMSRNNADSSLRIFNSIRHYNLDITRAALVSGALLAPYLAAKRQAGPTGQVFGIDVIPGMIEASRRKATQAGEVITFQEGGIDQIPFADGQFDVVLCSFMIFHMSEVRTNPI